MLHEADETKIALTGNGCARRMLRILWMAKKTNEETRSMLGKCLNVLQ